LDAEQQGRREFGAAAAAALAGVGFTQAAKVILLQFTFITHCLMLEMRCLRSGKIAFFEMFHCL